MMATDFGTDIKCGPDLDPMLGLVSGREALLDDIVWRLSTVKGSLFYDPDYGIDLRQAVNDAVTPSDVLALQQDIGAELRRDERISQASAAVTFIPESSTLIVTLKVTSADGPFKMVLSATAYSVALLSAGAV